MFCVRSACLSTYACRMRIIECAHMWRKGGEFADVYEHRVSEWFAEITWLSAELPRSLDVKHVFIDHLLWQESFRKADVRCSLSV